MSVDMLTDHRSLLGALVQFTCMLCNALCHVAGRPGRVGPVGAAVAAAFARRTRLPCRGAAPPTKRTRHRR